MRQAIEIVMSGLPFEKAAAEKDELAYCFDSMELYKIMIGYCIFYPKMLYYARIRRYQYGT